MRIREIHWILKTIKQSLKIPDLYLFLTFLYISSLKNFSEETTKNFCKIYVEESNGHSLYAEF